MSAIVSSSRDFNFDSAAANGARYLLTHVERPDGDLELAAVETIVLFMLTWKAGVVDAVTYLRLDVFTTMMTGNTVLFAAMGTLITGPSGPRGESRPVITGALGREIVLPGNFVAGWRATGPAPGAATRALSS